MVCVACLCCVQDGKEVWHTHCWLLQLLLGLAVLLLLLGSC
jgi:hypothetical protein